MENQNQKNRITISAIAENALASPQEGAQALLDTIAGLRAAIPTFPFHVQPGKRRSLTRSKSVPPEFIEQSNTAMQNEPLLARGGVDPDQTRSLVRYATAYGPVADALEAAAKEMRESVDSAQAKAGIEALTTYKVAARLARRPDGAHLGTLVQTMRRTLGRGRRSKKPAEAEAPGTNATPTPAHTTSNP
jgi:hypothetical protein